MRWHPQPEPIAPGQESVWDYPRPPRLEAIDARLEVDFGGVTIASTSNGYRVLETSHPPVYYFPPDSIAPGVLQRAEGASFCEWKGAAVYFDVRTGTYLARRAAWAYPDPSPEFEPIRSYVAFYADAMDECRVDGEVVVPQPGGFYGGWITSSVAGPFKGVPGSAGW